MRTVPLPVQNLGCKYHEDKKLLMTRDDPLRAEETIASEVSSRPSRIEHDAAECHEMGFAQSLLAETSISLACCERGRLKSRHSSIEKCAVAHFS